MRILWVRRRSLDEGAGDSLYDEKLIRALSSTHEIVQYGLKRNTKPRQMLRAALNLSLPEQYGVGGPEDVAHVRALLAGGGFDAVVISHEHLDAFAHAVRGATKIPFIAVRQNVTSDAMASILQGTPIAGLYLALAQAQERAALRSATYDAITAISVRDRRLLRTLSGREDIALVSPGAPPASPLNADAAVARELVISGTFDWFPKARDVRRFVAEYAAAPPADVRLRCAASIAADQRAALGATEDDAIDAASAIRFGLITDRFTAGHKLKTAAYLMSNCAVLSFAKVIEDYADLPFARDWIVEIESVADIDPAMQRLAARPAFEARNQLITLKAAVMERFAWSRQGEALSAAIASAKR